MNMTENTTSVHLRPMRDETGALRSAPKKAPPWSTDTTLDETSFVRFVFGFPSASTMSNCTAK